jgi:hypothetical protein
MPVDRSDARRFITRTETLVTPGAVATMHRRAEMLTRLPVGVQKRIVRRASGKDPHVGFIVEPFSLFLAYELTDAAAARRLLPRGYELVPSAVFAGTELRICGVIGVFNVHTSVFWGTRVELSLIAQNTTTGLLSWVICDYESNTISYDPGQGFSASSTRRCVATTSYAGELIVDVQSAHGPNQITGVADLRQGTTRPLDQRLWLEGNLSVDYGGALQAAGTVPFGLIFDPREVEQALDLPLDAVTLEHMTFGDGILAPEPFEACCFPYAQHYLTTSFPTSSPIRDREGLEQAVATLNAQAE